MAIGTYLETSERVYLHGQDRLRHIADTFAPLPQGLTEFEHLYGDTMRAGSAPATPAKQDTADARASPSTPATATSALPGHRQGTPPAPPPAAPRTAGSRAL